MLCPEVLRPKTRASRKERVEVRSGRSGTEALSKTLGDMLEKVKMFEAVKVFLPNTIRLPESLLHDLTRDGEFYRVDENFRSEVLAREG